MALIFDSSWVRRKGGFVLITAALTIALFIGFLGLCVDLARMYIAKNEVQAFVDAATLAAGFELDGTRNGIDHGRDAAQNYPNQWNFRTAAPENIEVGFATDKAGPYVAVPPDADVPNVAYVRVRAEASPTMFFLPAFGDLAFAMLSPISSRQQTLPARAAAGQFELSRFREGLLPFSPDAINPADPNFGYLPGQQYTLRWPPPGQRNKPGMWCDGDEAVGFVTPSPAAARGFIDIGEGAGGMGAAFIREAIVNNAQTHDLEIGDKIINSPGNKSTENEAMRERYQQDTDLNPGTYAEYIARIRARTSDKGNGRRMVIVPVNDPTWDPIAGESRDIVLGYGLFFMPDMLMCGPPGGGAMVSPCCAEYVGSAMVPGRRSAREPGGPAYKLRLFE